MVPIGNVGTASGKTSGDQESVRFESLLSWESERPFFSYTGRGWLLA